MANFLDLPAELRQQILRHFLPNEVRAAGPRPRARPLLALILSCEKIKFDVEQLLKVWPPVFCFERPTHVTSQLWKSEESVIRTVRLRLFAEVDLEKAHKARHGSTGWDCEGPWTDCVSKLPRTAVETVIVDLTAVPVWMVERRPDWVRTALMDRRNRRFLNQCLAGIDTIVGRLWAYYRGRVSIQFGGDVTRKAKTVVDLMLASAKAAGVAGIEFTGTWMSGTPELPTRLSLYLISHCWGIVQKDSAGRAAVSKDRMIQIRNEARKEGIKVPDLDLLSLGPVRWSTNSCTHYFVNALKDEDRTREELVLMLGFAVEVGATGPAWGPFYFEPATMERRKLQHSLAKDLGLASRSVGGDKGELVRISHAAEPEDSPQYEAGYYGVDDREEQERLSDAKTVQDDSAAEDGLPASISSAPPSVQGEASDSGISVVVKVRRARSY